MAVLDFLFEVVFYTTARFILPAITFNKVRVANIPEDGEVYNWLGFRTLKSGQFVCSATVGQWIGLLLWTAALIIFLWLVR